MAAPLPPQATPGTVVGEKYVLEAVIGRGGMGVVLAARHMTLGKRVAVKLLLAEADENARARFELEAQAAALIASPHIAEVLDFGVTKDGLAYLVMEFLEGRDLQVEKRLRVRLPVAEAVDIVLEASVGIAQAHAAGLVHRDIKPANVFLANVAGRRVVKVLDFGLIKVMADGASGLTGTTETFGTPKYMAPEQLRSARNVDARADQHALAAILFEMITGRPPFDGESVPDIIIKIGTEPAPLASSVGVPIPPALDAALQRAMQKRADQRFSSLAEFAAAIAPFGSPRAAEIATEIERCLAYTLGKRPVLQHELRRTVQMPRPTPTPLHPSSSSGFVPPGAFDPSMIAPAFVGESAVVGAPYTAISPHAERDPHAASALDSAVSPALVTAPTLPVGGASGSGTLSSGSMERFRAADPPATPARRLLTIGAVAFVAAAATVGSIVYFVSRDRPSSTQSAIPSANVTTGVAEAVAPSAAPSAHAPPAASAAASEAPMPSAPLATTSTATADAVASGKPKPASTTVKRPPTTTATQKPCASLDCLR